MVYILNITENIFRTSLLSVLENKCMYSYIYNCLLLKRGSLLVKFGTAFNCHNVSILACLPSSHIEAAFSSCTLKSSGRVVLRAGQAAHGLWTPVNSSVTKYTDYPGISPYFGGLSRLAIKDSHLYLLLPCLLSTQ